MRVPHTKRARRSAYEILEERILELTNQIDGLKRIDNSGPIVHLRKIRKSYAERARSYGLSIGFDYRSLFYWAEEVLEASVG